MPHKFVPLRQIAWLLPLLLGGCTQSTTQPTCDIEQGKATMICDWPTPTPVSTDDTDNQ